MAGSGQPTSASSGQPASAWPSRLASVSLGRSALVCRAAACRGGAGGRDGGAWRWYCGCGGAGRCSHWMPASLQSWWDRCHGEGPAALAAAALGAAGEAERLGWNPGPPARPRSAWVAPSARGAGFGVSGEDQDPSGSRRGEGTALAARQGLASGLGLALSGLALSGLALSGLAAGGGCGARRNHPAGGATPGQERSSAAGPSWLARLRFAPRGRRPVPGVGSEPSGPAARTKGAQGSPSRPSGTGLYAAVLPPARNHYDDSHSTGHFLYSSQTPVQAHFLAKRPSVPILAVSRPYGMARGLMLPIESKRVQRAIFR